MNKKYGIGFLIGTIVLVVLFFFAYRISYSRAQEKEMKKHVVNAEEEIENCYYIKESDGYVTVYTSDQKTVYEYTSILVDELPEKIQEKVKKGIKVTSLSQLYGFLENYSS